MRIKFCRNEKRAYVYLFRRGYTISTLSKMFGRSTSVLWRIKQRATNFKKNGINIIPNWHDMRKIPENLRRRIKAMQHKMLLKRLKSWETFILGEEDEPP